MPNIDSKSAFFVKIWCVHHLSLQNDCNVY